VAAGLKVTKTSIGETEGGMVDTIYSRDGIPVDDDHRLDTDIGRPKPDRQRNYLAKTATESCRGRAGLVVQMNYRPFDDDSFNNRDIDGSKGSDHNTLNFGGDVQPIWFAVNTGAGVGDLYSLEELRAYSGPPI